MPQIFNVVQGERVDLLANPLDNSNNPASYPVRPSIQWIAPPGIAAYISNENPFLCSFQPEFNLVIGHHIVYFGLQKADNTWNFTPFTLNVTVSPVVNSFTKVIFDLIT